MRISKSKFVAGVQCLKRLYLQVHEPDLAGEPSETTQAIIEQGRQVGLVAQQAFPGGVTVASLPGDLSEALETTRELVAKSDAPAIFEATFQHEGVLVRADVLQRNGRSNHNLVEVKSATSVKPHYLYDIGIQRLVLTGADISVNRTSLMHLNSNYVFGGRDYDISNLFVTVEVKPEESVSKQEISDRLKEQFRILNRKNPPDIKPGRHCTDPVVCEFFEMCNPEVSPDHVSRLPRISPERIEELVSLGISSIKQIPADFPLTERQRIAADSVQKGKPFIRPELGDELDSLKYPLCFMDFETIFPALPRFEGMRTYDQIPFQWSVHRQEKPGAQLEHFEFLAEGSSDPRVPFVQSLCEAVAGAGTIVVYNESFEYSRLDDLAKWLPNYAAAIETIKESMWDLLVALRQSVYHPSFGGSFSLKSVLPAFVPEMSYENMEISEGTAAGLAWEKYVSPSTPEPDRQRLRSALLEYCKQDTMGLANLLERLKHYPKSAVEG